MNSFLLAGLNNAAWAAAMALVVAIIGKFYHRPALLHAAWLLVLVKLLTPSLVEIDPARFFGDRKPVSAIISASQAEASDVRDLASGGSDLASGGRQPPVFAGCKKGGGVTPPARLGEWTGGGRPPLAGERNAPTRDVALALADDGRRHLAGWVGGLVFGGRPGNPPLPPPDPIGPARSGAAS